jgi:formylglycine-generating enzyme required for sulfatase activity
LTIGEKEDGGNRRLQLLAGKALYNFQTIRRETHVVSRTCEKLYRLIGCDAELGQRIKAGIILGGLGDSRIVLDNMVPVPAGEFIRGSNDMEEQEKPEQHIFLDGFMIGKYPVTNQEYKSFISDNGYHKEEFWTHEGWLWRMKENISEPRFWRDRKWNGPNFPVVGIGWYEAVAYANWLSSVSGENYRLPSEAEWEKAARGTDGKRFPWGNDFDFNKDLCNSKLLNLRKTTPVGIFPRDKSIFGCFDMAGNVHEWCADWYDKDYYKIYPLENPVGPSNGSDRVFRGGSWGYGPDFCRVARRFCFPPNGLRFGSVGFRLVKPL